MDRNATLLRTGRSECCGRDELFAPVVRQLSRKGETSVQVCPLSQQSWNLAVLDVSLAGSPQRLGSIISAIADGNFHPNATIAEPARRRQWRYWSMRASVRGGRSDV